MRRIVSALGKVNWGKSAFGVFALCITTAIALRAQTFNTLHSFDGTDGYGPTARLVQTTTGDLYGTTSAGGANPVSVVAAARFSRSPRVAPWRRFTIFVPEAGAQTASAPTAN